MQLRRVKLVNFRQHDHTDIALGPGITAIIGPNGAGKSTLLEAVAWTFYGNPAARGSRDSIRWNRAPARSSVRAEVEFALGSHEFRVVRGLYNAELYQDRFDEPIANSQQEVSARMERVLGMTRDEFFNTYFTGQKELAVMAAMGPTERARFLSRVLGYEKLRLAQDKLRGRRSELRGEVTGLERGLADPDELARERDEAAARVAETKAALEAAERAHAEAERRLADEEPAWKRMVELRESVLSLDGERRVAERDVLEARREFGRLDRELAEAMDARRRLRDIEPELDRVAPLRAERDRLEDEARAAGRRRSLSGQRRELEEQIAHVTERWKGLQDVDTVLAKAGEQLAAARGALREAEAAEDRARTAWVRDTQDAQTKRLSLRDQYLELQKHRETVVAAGEDGECPICKRPLGGEYQEVLETLGRQLEEIEVRGRYFKQRVEQLAQEPKEVRDAERRTAEASARVERALQEVARCEDRRRERDERRRERDRLAARRAELEREIAALPDAYDAERHDAVRAALKELEPVVNLATELKVKAGRAEQLVQEAEAAERALSDKEARVRQLEEALAELGFDETTYEQARERYEAATARVRETEVELVSRRADVQAAETAVAGAERRLAERARRAERLDHLKREMRLHDELDRGLHDLRLELNAAMRPELAERASAFLADLTDGRYHELELDEQYQVLILEDAVPKPVISGGEEDLANLVLRLAISQMVAERAGQPLSLLVLDEIFGSLDEHRRENVVQLLRGLADRFPQVILITHVESVKEGVDRVLRVTLDERRGATVVTDDGEAGGDEDVAA